VLLPAFHLSWTAPFSISPQLLALAIVAISLGFGLFHQHVVRYDLARSQPHTFPVSLCALYCPIMARCMQVGSGVPTMIFSRTHMSSTYVHGESRGVTLRDADHLALPVTFSRTLSHRSELDLGVGDGVTQLYSSRVVVAK